ncbi:hypothetical protein [Paenisporosarcina quisquiliarum]|uniref:tubby C-terminal domain-like protein n=1 Tax=Paenisporosarcina quisquiliarum TaxID=365346 RepID=UPI003736695B
MQSYSYSIPESYSYYTSIPIYNKDNNVICILMKNRHQFLTQLFHSLLELGMPYCYNVFSNDYNPIYKIDCLFTGIGYSLQNRETMDKVPIKQKRVQLIEKMQLFIINGEVYKFEKDYTYSGSLKKNDIKIATIKNIDNTNINKTKRIRIEAINDDIASLIAVMYQTFVFEK